MSRAVPDWFRASALRGIPNAGWARAVSESVVSWRRGVGIVIRIGNDMRLAKMHSPAVASHGAANPPPSVRSDQATRSRLIGDSTSIHAGAHEREILNIPKLPEVKSSDQPSRNRLRAPRGGTPTPRTRFALICHRTHRQACSRRRQPTASTEPLGGCHPPSSVQLTPKSLFRNTLSRSDRFARPGACRPRPIPCRASRPLKSLDSIGPFTGRPQSVHRLMASDAVGCYARNGIKRPASTLG